MSVHSATVQLWSTYCVPGSRPWGYGGEQGKLTWAQGADSLVGETDFQQVRVWRET